MPDLSKLVRPATSAIAAVAVSALLAACGSSGKAGAGSLVVYSGRNKELVGPLLDRFADQTGISVQVRYGDSPAIAAQVVEEGKRSPADVVFVQDAASIDLLDDAGLLAELPAGTLDEVDARFRAEDGDWVGTSGRVRVVAYNTESLKEDEVPDHVAEVVEKRWEGKVGIAPTNASFQSFVAGMVAKEGKTATLEFLKALKANDARTYPNNLTIVDAVAKGEIELGLVNHYYLFNIEREKGKVPVANHFLADGDPGALLNVAPAAILKTAENSAQARRFVDYLLSKKAQEYFRDETDEYPLASGVAAPKGLPPLDTLGKGQVDLSSLGKDDETARKLLEESGLS